MKRRRYLILGILAVTATALLYSWSNSQGTPRRGVVTSSLHSLESSDPDVEIQSRLRAEAVNSGDRALNRSGTAGSKLAFRDGEIGVVQIPTATLEHLIDKLHSSDEEARVPSDMPRLIGVYNIKSLVSLLDDHDVGGASVSESPVASLGQSGKAGRVEVTDSDDSTVSLSIEIDCRSGSKLRSSITTTKGSAVVCSSGGPDRSGFLFVVGGSVLDQNAQE
jgi:hypothetical protein